jgi:hypothetical protein
MHFICCPLCEPGLVGDHIWFRYCYCEKFLDLWFETSSINPGSNISLSKKHMYPIEHKMKTEMF